MAFAEKNFAATASTTSTAIYTAPASTTAQILSIRATNKGTATTTITLLFRDSTSGIEYEMAKTLAVPASSTIDLTAGRLILETGDQLKIQASANSNVVIIGSVAERT